MKKLISLIVLLALLVPAAWAQSVNIQQVNETTSSNLQSHTEEFGNGNIFKSEDLFSVFTQSDFISVLQRLTIDANQVAKIKMVGDRNSTTLTQSGTSNVGIINIEGNGNNASLNQLGSGHLSAIKIDGNANNLDVTQDGTNLQNLIVLDGTGLSFNVQQTNTGVQLTQTGSSIPLQIESTGNKIPLFISNN